MSPSTVRPSFDVVRVGVHPSTGIAHLMMESGSARCRPTFSLEISDTGTVTCGRCKIWAQPIVERFFAKVNKTSDGCWIWRGAKTTTGYGSFRTPLRAVYAHRFCYETLVGSIPDGLCIDHLCRTPLCVNPSHLEPVTAQENTLRGESPAVKQLRDGVCKRGHALTPENIYVSPKGHRNCWPCCRERSLATYYRNKERLNA